MAELCKIRIKSSPTPCPLVGGGLGGGVEEDGEPYGCCFSRVVGLVLSSCYACGLCVTFQWFLLRHTRFDQHRLHDVASEIGSTCIFMHDGGCPANLFDIPMFALTGDRRLSGCRVNKYFLPPMWFWGLEVASNFTQGVTAWKWKRKKVPISPNDMCSFPSLQGGPI
jgi:hypothetical protein